MSRIQFFTFTEERSIMYPHRVAALRFLRSAGVVAAFGLLATGAKLYVAALSTFKIGAYSIVAGSAASGTVTLTGVGKGGVPVVTFSSSNSAVASVPASKAVSMYGTATVPVNGLKAGCARITASYGGNSRFDDIVVHPVSTTSGLSISVPEQYVLLGGTSQGSVTTALKLGDPTRPESGGTLTLQRASILLSSSNPAVAKVPSSVTQVTTSTSFPITGTGEGCAIITATVGSSSVSKTVRVIYVGG